ncbi:hypothetical protein H4Q26_017211 [Puccinia striiformis f. sp. tritici PST-130]|nr:hypothetical protein H4Q26_017211 [Puccinia striiformis f. sp. tritici PST-130]
MAKESPRPLARSLRFLWLHYLSITISKTAGWWQHFYYKSVELNFHPDRYNYHADSNNRRRKRSSEIS